MGFLRDVRSRSDNAPGPAKLLSSRIQNAVPLLMPTLPGMLKSKISFMPKVGFVSLGCPKNLVDSEVMMGTLAQSGYEITSDSSEADTVVVNTCGFIESAKQESVDAILEATRLKQDGKATRVIVAGCLVERYRADLIKELPEVDAFIGTSQVSEILKAADDRFDAKELTLKPIGNKTA